MHAMEDLQARHRKELKELQGRLTSKKKNASKKTRKGVNDECAALEKETQERHAAEIAALSGSSPTDGDGEGRHDQLAITKEHDEAEDADLCEQTQSLRVTEGEGQEPRDAGGVSHPPGKKRNRQKERLAKRAAEQEAAAAQAAEEAQSLPDRRKQERDQFMAEFNKRGLEEKAVAANGHCMYSAIADQLHQLGLRLDPAVQAETKSEDQRTEALSHNDYKLIRKVAAEYISNNGDDFVPFLEEPLDDYVQKVRDTGEWGGQLELMALAKSYRIDVNVLQGDGRVEKIEGGGGSGERSAWLAYYRHGFGLGEHYNSLRRAASKATAPPSTL